MLMPVFLVLVRLFGLYTIVYERTCHVYVLFGKVVATLDEPGLHFLPRSWAGGVHRQLAGRATSRHAARPGYLRSQPVNSEEGAPMGIGIWYEMYISDPVAYLLRKNFQLVRAGTCGYTGRYI